MGQSRSFSQSKYSSESVKDMTFFRRHSSQTDQQWLIKCDSSGCSETLLFWASFSWSAPYYIRSTHSGWVTSCGIKFFCMLGLTTLAKPSSAHTKAFSWFTIPPRLACRLGLLKNTVFQISPQSPWLHLLIIITLTATMLLGLCSWIHFSRLRLALHAHGKHTPIPEPNTTQFLIPELPLEKKKRPPNPIYLLLRPVEDSIPLLKNNGLKFSFLPLWCLWYL